MARKGARKQAERSQDRERVARARLDQLPEGLWKEIRLSASPKVRRVCDALIAKGSLSLADVAHLELFRVMDGLEVEREARERYEAERVRVAEGAKPDYTAPGLNAIRELRSVTLQERKHLRMVLIAMGPSLTANDMPVRVPEGFDLEGMQRKVDDLEDDEILS